MPIVNRAIANRDYSAHDLCALSADELKLKSDLKVYKHLLNGMVDEPAMVSEIFTAQQNEFLRQHGITHNGFNPPSTPNPFSDSYSANTFEIKPKGFSSLPKVDLIIERINNGGNVPKAGIFMKDTIERIMANGIGNLSAEGQIEWLRGELASTSEVLAHIRNSVQYAKFAVILGKKWFKDLPSRDNPTMTHQGIGFTFELGEKTIKI